MSKGAELEVIFSFEAGKRFRLFCPSVVHHLYIRISKYADDCKKAASGGLIRGGYVDDACC